MVPIRLFKNYLSSALATSSISSAPSYDSSMTASSIIFFAGASSFTKESIVIYADNHLAGIIQNIFSHHCPI
jgi:nicotinamide mononucleotide (NMN) deamidase PncC